MTSLSSSACAICLRSTQRAKIGIPESCAHEFCFSCILEWSKNINTCPIDRGKFNTINVYQEGRKTAQVAVPDRQFDEFSLYQDEYIVTCEVCGLSDRDDRLLLCDGCDLGYHLECLTPPLSAVPSGNWYCPTCAPILGISPQRQNGRRRRPTPDETVDLADSEDETVSNDHYNLRPRSMCINVEDYSGDEAELESHSYSLRSSANGNSASRRPRGVGNTALDSSGVANLDRTSVVTAADNDSDTSDALCQRSRRRRLPSRELLLSSDDGISNVNLVSSGSESDEGGVCVRRRRVGRRKRAVSLRTSDSESEVGEEAVEMDGCMSGSGEADVPSGGEHDRSYLLSCESGEDSWNEWKGRYSPDEESEDSTENSAFNNASTISIHSGQGEASNSDVTRVGKPPRKGQSPSTHPRSSSKGGLRTTRTAKGKERAESLPPKSSRKRKMVTMQPAKRPSSQTQRKGKRRMRRRMFRGKSRKRVIRPVLPRKRRLSALESSGTSSGYTVVCIPETPEAKRYPSPGHSRAPATPTLASHPQARVAASTPTSSLRQVKVQRAVREYATTGALSYPDLVWEPQQRQMEQVSNDRLIESWVQRKRHSPSWMKEAVERRIAERGSPSRRRGAPSLTETSRETPSRVRWNRAELLLRRTTKRPLPQVQRSSLPLPPATPIDVLGIMGHMDLLQSDKATIRKDGSVVPFREGSSPSTE